MVNIAVMPFLNRFILTPLAYYIARMFFLTVRIKSINEEIIDPSSGKWREAVVALWHHVFFPSIGYGKSSRIYKPLPLSAWATMVNWWRRSLFVSEFALSGGQFPGSVGGSFCYSEDLAQKPFIYPFRWWTKGPKGGLKNGIIKTCPIVSGGDFPTLHYCGHAWILKGWDHFLIPKPFSRVIIRFGSADPCPGKWLKENWRYSIRCWREAWRGACGWRSEVSGGNTPLKEIISSVIWDGLDLHFISIYRF